MTNHLVFAVALLSNCPLISLAQATDSLAGRVFQLGEVTVVGSAVDSVDALTIREIESFNRLEVSTALNLLPGISLANVGPRNESVVYVRGFDLRQVPVFIDGIPVYVPYDGYVDMARFTTFDLARIDVAKGFASILYGANTMGGAINLISRKPAKKLEINGRAGIFSGEGYRWNVNAGSFFDKYYVQMGVSQLRQDYYPLSDDFPDREFEDGGARENSYREDFKLSFKAGFTPNATDEYVVSYVNQQGEKGTPPYVGDDAAMRTRFWQWPDWDKQSLYFISRTTLGQKAILKSKLYYDDFENALFSYDDSTYATITRPYAFQSYYDDYSVGGNAEVEVRTSPNNVLKFAAQLKHDVHRENNRGEPQRNFIDNTASLGVENVLRLRSFTFIPGLSYNVRHSVEAQDYNAGTGDIVDFPSNRNDAVNLQAGFFWDVSIHHTLKASVSRKTRFATIKDRYSYRLGQAIPNPDLGAEVAINYDLTYAGRLFKGLAVNASLFRSDITDIIQQVDNVEPGRFQLQNAGDALFYGAELGADYQVAGRLRIGGNYTYLQRKNQTQPEIFFTNVPDHKVFGYIEYDVAKRLMFLVNIEHDSERYSTSYGTTANAFTIFNVKMTADLTRSLDIETGVNNFTDENYTLIEGFPEAGRNFFLTLSFKTL